MQIAFASISLTLMVHFRKGLHLQADTTQSTSNMLDKLTGNAHLASPLKETVSLPTHQQSHNWFIPVQKYQVTSTFKSVRMYVRFTALFRRHVKLLHQSLSRLTSPRSSIETACFLIQAISWSETSREINRPLPSWISQVNINNWRLVSIVFLLTIWPGKYYPFSTLNPILSNLKSRRILSILAYHNREILLISANATGITLIPSSFAPQENAKQFSLLFKGNPADFR